MILIRDAEVVDGTGAPPKKADVLVNGERIAAIGEHRNARVDTVIDGRGGYLCPGFIDVNTQSDHFLTLFSNPEQQDFLEGGVTTIIGGQGGASLAPLLYGSLESIRKWADPNSINVNWHSLKDFFGILMNQGIGVNFGTLVGHGTLRRALIGEALRDLTVRELEVLRQSVKNALDDGALGLSTGLGYAHSSEVPVTEIKSLLEVVKHAQGIYSTFLRNEKEGIDKSLQEVIHMARDMKIPTLINQFRPILGFEKYFNKAIGHIDTAPRSLPLYFDTSPSHSSLLPIYSLLPRWAQRGSLEAMRQELQSAHTRERLIKDFGEIRESDITILRAHLHPYLEGKSLSTFAKNRGLKNAEALFQLMKLTRLRATVLYRNINLDLALQSLTHVKALIGSHAASFHEKMHGEKLTHIFLDFLHIATRAKLMPIENIIQKYTSLPAQLFGLSGRGEIKDGNIADLVLIKKDRVTDVLVNGEMAIENNVVKKSRGGMILKRA